MTHDAGTISPPGAWLDLNGEALSERILLLGPTDSGKSTLARWLVNRMVRSGRRVGWIDGDIGQSMLGLPTTMNLALVDGILEKVPSVEKTFFIGSSNAAGHAPAILAGLKQLHSRALDLEAERLIIDTTGFVDKMAGGLTLKQWKIELLRPGTILALQRQRELEPILAPLRKHRAFQVVDLPIVPEVRRKSTDVRRKRRRGKLKAYFEKAVPLCIDIPELPIHDLPLARRFSVLGLLDEQGFCLELGVILEHRTRQLEILTPLVDTSRLAAVRVGASRLDPATGLEIS